MVSELEIEINNFLRNRNPHEVLVGKGISIIPSTLFPRDETTCWLCEKSFLDGDKIVKCLYHLTGFCRGVAHDKEHKYVKEICLICTNFFIGSAYLWI